MITGLDVSIVAIYISLVLLGGFLVQYIKKVRKHLTFIVTEAKAPWYIVMGLLIAEMIHGGQTVGYAGWIQLFKLSALWYLIIIAVGFAWQIPIAAKVRKEELRTIPEIVLRYMDAKSSIIVGLINIFFYIAVMGAVCLLSFAAFAEVIFGWPGWLSMLIIIAICIFYSSTAGLWSIGYLNFLQYLIICLGIGVTAYFSISAAGGFAQITAALPPDFYNMTPGPVGIGFITLMIVFFWFCGYMIWAGTNRSLMSGSSPRTTTEGAIAASLGYIPFMVFITLCGIAAYVLYTLPGKLPSPDMALPLLIKDFVPTGLAGLSMAAVMAAMVTTSANCLFASGTTISYDIVQKFVKPSASDSYLNWLARISMVALAFAMYAVCVFWRPLVLVALMFAYAIAAGGIIMPACFAYIEHLWGRSRKTLLTPDGFFWGCVSGFIAGLAWYFVTAGDITWACQFGAVISGTLALGISAVQRMRIKEPTTLTRSEKMVRVTALLLTISVGILVGLRIAGIIW